jgi:hypothetical protein
LRYIRRLVSTQTSQYQLHSDNLSLFCLFGGLGPYKIKAMMTSFLDFLNKATAIETLHKIRLEVHGETDVADPLVVKKKQTRINSATLQGLVDDHYDSKCGDRTSDFTCMLSFMKESMSQLDFSTSKNSRKKWHDEALDTLDQWLLKIQRLVMFSQREDSEGLRGAFVKINAIAREYFLKKYKKQPALSHEVFQKHWRKIMRGDKGVVLSLLDKKAAAMRYRLENKFEVSWDHVTSTMRRYANNLSLNDDEFTSIHATQLEMCIEANAGPRKIAVLDPIIKFYTYGDYQKHLKNIGVIQPSVFRIGDEKSKIIIDDITEALLLFKEENIIIQVGVAKDKDQRDNRFLEMDDDRYIDGAVVYKPTAIFSAKDTIAMIERVRRFFKLNMKTRPTHSKARVKMGALISSRLTEQVLKADWPNLYKHAKKHGFQLSTHIFRKIYAVAIASDELCYLQNIRSLTGRRVDKVVLQAHALRHTSSYATVQSYSNVHISWGMLPKLLVAPDKALLLNLMSKMEFLTNEYDKLKRTVENVARESKEVQRAVDAEGSLNPAEKAIKKLRTRKIPGTWKSQKESDEDIRFVLSTLNAAGVKMTKINVGHCKIGSQRFSEYKKRNKDWRKHLEKKKEDEASDTVQQQSPPAKLKASQRKRKTTSQKNEPNNVNKKARKALIEEHPGLKVSAKTNFARETATFGADLVMKSVDCKSNGETETLTIEESGLRADRQLCTEQK